MTAQTHQTPDANDVLMGGGGAPTAKFPNEAPGTTVGGRIVTPPRAHQEREYKPGQPGMGNPKFYPSGDPIFGITIDVQTNQRDNTIEDDDGVRRIFVEGKRLKDAVRDAVRNAGAQKLEVGGELHVTFTGLGQAENGLNAPKLWAARYVPAAQAAVMGGDNQQINHAQNTQQAPPQQHLQPVPNTPPAVAAPQQQPAAQPAANGPTPEQVAAVRAAGLDPAAVFPGYTGA